MSTPTPKNDLAERDYPRPTLNNNGTGKADLREQIINVRYAVRKLGDAMATATPHGRDYQTQDPSVFNESLASWRAAQLLLAEASNVVNEYYYHLANEFNR